MPGRNDRGLPGACLMSAFAAYRTGVNAADADLSFTQTIDLSASPNALHNVIVLAVKRTAGTGAVSVELYRNAPVSSLSADWVLADTAAAMASLSEIRFKDLYAGVYKVKVTVLDAGATWTLHESHLAY